MRRDPERAVGWRREMRRVLSALLPTTQALPDPDAPADPARLGVASTPGDCAVVGFASGDDADAPGERVGWYVLERMTP
jgi:hypothetical protein